MRVRATYVCKWGLLVTYVTTVYKFNLVES